jgi:hypothetical protein
MEVVGEETIQELIVEGVSKVVAARVKASSKQERERERENEGEQGRVGRDKVECGRDRPRSHGQLFHGLLPRGKAHCE